MRGGLRTLLDLTRVSNLPTVWSNAGAAALIAGGTLLEAAVPAAALSLLYCAGMVMNDCCDAREDAVLRPDRPIPSGRIGKRAAAALALLLFAGAIPVLALTGRPAAVGAGALLAATIAAYDVLHARWRHAPLLMAACRFGCYAVTSAAVAGTLTIGAAAGGGIQFLYILGVTVAARRQKRSGASVPVPLLLAAIPLVDGCAAAAAGFPRFFLPAAGAVALSAAGQRLVRGD